jgi:aspartyl-tRNA(Asn)/glutamyl-tRNA(Gln) amidotransferase subunit A
VVAGAQLRRVSIPEASERESYFPISMPVQLLNTLGRERFEENRHLMDPVIADRTAKGLGILATELLEVETRRERSISRVASRLHGVDACVSPTTASTAPSVASLSDFQEAYQQALNMTRNTQPANYLALCAVSLPLPVGAQSSLPVGLQLMTPAGQDEKLLAIALAVEKSLAVAS